MPSTDSTSLVQFMPRMSRKSVSSDGILIVFGSGPGIGVAVASLFAQKADFDHIVLIARREEQLSKDSASVRTHNREVKISTISADVSNLGALRELFSRLLRIGRPGCIFFNAARVSPSQFFDFTAEELQADFQLMVSALYEVAKWSIPLLLDSDSKSPSLLVTNSLLYVEPIPWVFSLSLGKAAQRNLIQSLDAVYGRDVHIGLLSVGGFVSREEGRENMSPETIAYKAFEWFSQPKDSWTREIVVEEDPEVYKQMAASGP